MKSFCFLLLSLLGSITFAQSPSCLEIEDDKGRLACYDRIHGRVAVGNTNKTASSTTSFLSYITVRDEGLPNLLPTAGPAFLGYVKNGDKEGSLIKLSAIFTGPALTSGGSGLAPFGSFSVYRDLTATTPRNTLVGRVGLRNTFLDYTVTNVSVDSTASISTKEDRVKHTATDGFLISNKIVAKHLATGQPFGGSGIPFQLVPIVGAGVERIRSAPSGVPTGRSNYLYGGAALSVWPSIVPRLQANARYQRFNDLSASGGLDKRKLNYREASLDYYLFDPNNDKAVVQPILSISRELGDDPVAGIGSVNRTTIGLKFKIN